MVYSFEERWPSPQKEGHLNLGGKNPFGEEININSKYLTRDTKPWIPIMGECHFSRLPREDWEREILKMKAGGITLISTYLFWIYHEKEEGSFDFLGSNDVRTFITLCQACGVDVVLRIGPWAHGECRNGGFPDWLLKKGIPLRENHPAYLSYVHKWYHAISQEVQGLLYPQGGNVVMIQLENELTDGRAHLQMLKEIAKEEGLVVPIYTVTGWNSAYGAQIPEKEVMPVFGGYPEAPWEKHTKKLKPCSHYFFHHIRNDSAIGTDVIAPAKKEEGIRELPYEDYPFVTCELGGGIQVTHHRRPKIAPQDIYALSLIKIACGNNLPGYYMYHGGTNKICENMTFQESKESGYPNDYPILSYDFQAALGEFGLVRLHYRKLKLLHLFLQNFMEVIAPMESYLGKEQTQDRDNKTQLRYAMRKKDDAGFVFINNYQRLDTLKKHENVQFEIRVGDGKKQIFSEAGIPVNDGMSAFFPFGLTMGNEYLEYAQAQPICCQGDTYFFMAIDGIESRYQFQGKQGIVVSPGVNSCVQIGDIKIVTLTQEQAEHLYQLGGKVILSKGDCYKKDRSLVTYHVGNPDLTVAIWEKDHFKVEEKYVKVKEEKVSVKKTKGFTAPPLLQKELQLERKREVRQWEICLENDIDTGYLHIQYTGDAAQLYVGHTLIADDYYYGGKWLVPVKYLKGETITLLVSELVLDEIYLEVEPDMTLWEQIRVDYVPEYEREIACVF